MSQPLLFITGATGKVGRVFLEAFFADQRFANWQVRALCHQRRLPETERLQVHSGSIADRAVVQSAMRDVTHVLHMATCKETPEDVMDVTVKGMFWLLEEARLSRSFQQFVLIGGDAAVGHFFYPYDRPITDDAPFRPYPGCYPLSKVLEEVLLQQFYTMYDLPGCCLRAPWIMDRDDFRYSLSFGDDVFGGPRWNEMVTKESAAEYHRRGTVPLMLDAEGQPLRRNFVHVRDLARAILAALDNPRVQQKTLNISLDEPVDYGVVVAHLKRTRGLDSVPIPTKFHSTWLDNTRAKLLLAWRPEYDTVRLVDEAYDYVRAADDPRVVYYPG
jgi:UDP-glucose 4-epimerase